MNAGKSNARQVAYSRESGLPTAAWLPLPGGAAIEMVLIPPGGFWMGSRPEDPEYDPLDPPVQVQIGNPFYIGKTALTQAQWLALMGVNPAHFSLGEEYPIETVSWEACSAFCEKLSVSSGKRVRLPSEAEWEYACRAGSVTLYNYGDEIDLLDRYGWFRGNAGGQSHPVGQKLPNAWGLYDMHGGIDEYCQDSWHPSYKGVPLDGSAWIEGEDQLHRVLRGGSWYDLGEYCSSPHRNYYGLNEPSEDHGFRIVVEAGSPNNF